MITQTSGTRKYMNTKLNFFHQQIYNMLKAKGFTIC